MICVDIMKEFVCLEVSSSRLDRCLCRHGMGNQGTLMLKEPKFAIKKFKANDLRFMHIDVGYLPKISDESS